MNNYIAIQFPNRQEFDFFCNQNYQTSAEIVNLVNDISIENFGNTNRIYNELTTHFEEVSYEPNQFAIENAIVVYV